MDCAPSEPQGWPCSTRGGGPPVWGSRPPPTAQNIAPGLPPPLRTLLQASPTVQHCSSELRSNLHSLCAQNHLQTEHTPRVCLGGGKTLGSETLTDLHVAAVR